MHYLLIIDPVRIHYILPLLQQERGRLRYVRLILICFHHLRAARGVSDQDGSDENIMQEVVFLIGQCARIVNFDGLVNFVFLLAGIAKSEQENIWKILTKKN